MARVIRLEQPDDKAGHGAILGNYAVRNRFRRRQQIFERVTAVGFAVNKATLIQPPTFVDLRNSERTKIVTSIDGWDQSDAGLPWDLWRCAAIEPPARPKFFENSHNLVLPIPRGTAERGGDYSLLPTLVYKSELCWVGA